MALPSTLNWEAVWERTAAIFTIHLTAGRVHLLTEDTLRFATCLALEEFGIQPEALTVEAPVRELGRGKLDLLVDADGISAAIEFKYPRDARGPISPDTMTYGELLSDYHRVALLPTDERWVVQVLGDRLLRYLERSHPRSGISWPTEKGSMLSFTGAQIAGLRKTARERLNNWTEHDQISAVVHTWLPLPGGLTLIASRVKPILPPRTVRAADGQADLVSTSATPPVGSARDQILAAARRLAALHGTETLRKQDIVAEVLAGGGQHSPATLSQMISVHLCIEPGAGGYGAYADFERVGHGLYRLRSPEPR